MDVISRNLSGFVDWQPDTETEELCFGARTWHSGTRRCGWQGMHWQTHRQLRKKTPPCCTFCARLSGFCETLPSVTVLPCLLLTIITPKILTRQSRGSNLKRWVGIGIRRNSRIDVGSTNMLSNYSKVPHRKECEAGPGTEERQAGELNAHTDRLRRRKSKCSENKPQKLLQPLGNLLKAHKTKVCYNTWSYNGDPFHRFIFFFWGYFFFLFFSTGRGKLTRDWKPRVLQWMRTEGNPTCTVLALGSTFGTNHWFP